MSLRLLIDKDTPALVLVKMLIRANHNVITVNQVGLMSQKDAVVLNYARSDNRIVLTHNCRDFEDLHQENPYHPGILAIYENKDYSKDYE